MNIFESIFNESHLKESSFENIVDNDFLRSLFDEYNDKYFDGRLSVDKIGWSNRKTTLRAVACYDDWRNGLKWIEINPLLKGYPNKDTFRDLIVHEMIHLMYMGHGQDFQNEMNRLNSTFNLHVTITAEGDILKDLEAYRNDRLDARADKIKNNVNKPELQSIYDRLNDKYFEGKLPDNTILKFLPTKTYKTYNLSQVRPDANSDWVFEIKVNRTDTEKCMVPALIYIYVLDVLKTPKKEINAKVKEIEEQINA